MKKTDELRKRAKRIVSLLKKQYPDAKCALNYENPLQLLVATVLSAQCTDVRVNMVTPALFARYPNAESFANADRGELETAIKSTGFFRMKAKNIIACARDLVDRFGAKVPHDRESLESLAGVGRKTASVVMAAAFHEAALAVDTHVFRVAHRLGLTLGKTPRQVEADVTKLVPPEKWGDATHWMILHGRQVCKAPIPQCPRCPVNHLCPTPAILAKALTIKAKPRVSR